MPRIAVEVTHPDRVMFPAPSTQAGITKRELVDYYGEVADTMLPHLMGRALSVQRCGWRSGVFPVHRPSFADSIALFNAVAQHARAILESDPDALVAAAKSLSELSRPLLHAVPAEDAGTELARTNRAWEGLDQLSVTFDTYMRCGAIADARRVGQLLREHGVSRRVVDRPRPQTGLDSLTDSELKVAHLVAAGATNHAVAQRLCLSLHTVNSHLRNTFAKLGIRSRAELGSLINGPSPSGTKV